MPRRFDAAESYVTVPNADVFGICDMSAVVRIISPGLCRVLFLRRKDQSAQALVGLSSERLVSAPPLRRGRKLCQYA